ncbi:uncharacterized protein ReepA isoform X6 [Eurosta solidaginis]|uniref:uncharacterized protein ReepA isoform X6 n=1 Tax=Eurosta solidaginis TaxID=178769 RepID=UPI0035309ACB
MQNRTDWKNNAGGEEEWSSTSTSLRAMPGQQQKRFQKSVAPNLFQYDQDENELIYNKRWHAAAAQKQAYAAHRPHMYAVMADGSGYYRRYSLDAPPPPTDSIIYYNNKRSATFIGPPHNDASVDDIATSSTLSNEMIYPQAIDFDFKPSYNIRSNGAFYFNQNSNTKLAGSSADVKIINTEQVVHNLTLFGRILEVMQSWPLPHVSFTTACILVLLATFISPRLWAENIIFPAFRLSFGTLYPAYASYKAVRTKNVKEYVKWMMYWIVYAFFTCIETFTDIFLSWFPFYYEVKVIIVLWLLSPATKGSSTLYRKFVHPMLTRREQEIDEYLNQAKERGYSAVLQLGTKGVNYATNVIMQTALKTVQYGIGTMGNNQSPAMLLNTSQSDNEIQRHRNARLTRDDPDSYAIDANRIHRSASLGYLNAAQLEFSEDDEQIDLMPIMNRAIIRNEHILIEEQLFEMDEEDDEDVVDMIQERGAARSRALPARKLRSRKTSATTKATDATKSNKMNTKSTGGSSGIRGRRKLRDSTPDMDVEIE